MKAQRRHSMKPQRHNGTTAQRFFSGNAVLVWCALLLLASAGADAGEISAPADGGDALTVAVSGVSQVTGDRIVLGQVAEIRGGRDGLRDLAAGIDLGPAPRPGQERRLTGNSVAVTIKNTLGSRGALRLSVPDQLVVRGACQNLSEASLEAAFRRYVAGAVGDDEVEIRQITVRGLKSLPLGEVALTPATRQKGEIKGKTILRLAVSVDGKACGQVTVSGWVDRYVQVVCAARDVSRNTVLTEADVCFERVNIAEAPDRLVFDLSGAVGKRVRSTLQAGRCLQQHKLFDVPLVEKGARVKLLVSTGPVHISTLGIAKADGAAGDQIRVENLSSQKTVVGRILDAATVEVLF